MWRSKSSAALPAMPLPPPISNPISTPPMPVSATGHRAAAGNCQGRISAGAVSRPHLCLQGHRAADSGPAVRPRVESTAAAAPPSWRRPPAIPARRRLPRWAGLPNIQVFVLHPKGRVSDVQRRQMTTSTHANVHNIALEGSFDDAQALVRMKSSLPRLLQSSYILKEE